MEHGVRIVLVASGSSPDRAIAIARLLDAEAARRGWSERLEIRVGGIDGGAGRISDAGLASLAEHGIDAAGEACPDLRRRPALFDGAGLIVCDRGEVADVLVDWEQASAARFLCVTDIGAAGQSDEELDELAIGDEVALYQERVEEMLRQVVVGADAS